MDLTQLLIFLLIGIAAGWMASKVVRGRSLGLLGNLVAGVIGSFLGGYLFNLIGFPTGNNLIASFLTAFVGAIVLLWAIRLINK